MSDCTHQWNINKPNVKDQTEKNSEMDESIILLYLEPSHTQCMYDGFAH